MRGSLVPVVPRRVKRGDQNGHVIVTLGSPSRWDLSPQFNRLRSLTLEFLRIVLSMYTFASEKKNYIEVPRSVGSGE
jgi:hypothetical protein